MNIEELNLSVRSYNAVCRAGIRSVEELQEKLHDTGFIEEKFGMKTAAEIRDRLSEMEGTVMSEEKTAVVIDTPEYVRATILTKRIKANATAMQESLYEVCKGLADVAKDKLYKELGYSNFEDYARAEIGLAISQAKKYKVIGEKLDDETATRVAEIGVNKLYLLAMADEPVRQELIDSGAAEQDSVRELKEKIQQLKDNAASREADLGQQLDAAMEQCRNLTAERDKAQADTCHAHHETKLVRERANRLETKVTELENQVEELENRPAEHAVMEVSDPKQEARIEELERRIRTNESEYTKRLNHLKREHAEEVRSIKERAESDVSAIQAKLDDLMENAAPDDVIAGNAEFSAYLDSLYDALCNVEGFLEGIHNESRLTNYLRQYYDTIGDSRKRICSIIGEYTELVDGDADEIPQF